MKSLRFGLFAGHLLHSEVEASLTGTVVALCSEESPKRSEERISKVVRSSSDLELFEPHESPIQFLAYAFVHSFDFKSSELVIYSKLTMEQMKSVTRWRGDPLKVPI